MSPGDHGQSPPPGPDALDRLAAAYAAARDATKRARAALEAAQELEQDAKGDLMEALEAAGEGAAAVAYGVAYYLRLGVDGRRVDQEAIRRHEDALGPLGLAPRQVTRTAYPTLAALESRRREIHAAGLAVAELIETGPEILKLATKTLAAES